MKFFERRVRKTLFSSYLIFIFRILFFERCIKSHCPLFPDFLGVFCSKLRCLFFNANCAEFGLTKKLSENLEGYFDLMFIYGNMLLLRNAILQLYKMGLDLLCHSLAIVERSAMSFFWAFVASAYHRNSGLY